MIPFTTDRAEQTLIVIAYRSFYGKLQSVSKAIFSSVGFKVATVNLRTPFSGNLFTQGNGWEVWFCIFLLAMSSSWTPFLITRNLRLLQCPRVLGLKNKHAVRKAPITGGEHAFQAALNGFP